MDILTINTKELLSKDELIGFYKDIAQQQSNNYSILFQVILGLSVVFIGSTWLWNFVFAKKRIENEVKKQVDLTYQDLTEKLIKAMDSKFLDQENQLKNELKSSKAEISRLFALSCEDQKFYYQAFVWWVAALRYYHEIENVELIRISVDQILINLGQSNWYDQAPEDHDLENQIKDIEKLVPDVLSKEKKQIIKFISEKI